MLPRRPAQSSHGFGQVLVDKPCQGDSRWWTCPGWRGQKESALTCLDASRAYVSGSLWSGFGEGHGAFSDGPYGCQSPAAFFHPAFYPYAFNPEVRCLQAEYMVEPCMTPVCLASASALSQGRSLPLRSRGSLVTLYSKATLLLSTWSTWTWLCTLVKTRLLDLTLKQGTALQVGSVGVPEYETMRKIFPDPAQAAFPRFTVTPSGLVQVTPPSKYTSSAMSLCGLVSVRFRKAAQQPCAYTCTTQLQWCDDCLPAVSGKPKSCLAAAYLHHLQHRKFSRSSWQ